MTITIKQLTIIIIINNNNINNNNDNSCIRWTSLFPPTSCRTTSGPRHELPYNYVNIDIYIYIYRERDI